MQSELIYIVYIYIYICRRECIAIRLYNTFLLTTFYRILLYSRDVGEESNKGGFGLFFNRLNGSV